MTGILPTALIVKPIIARSMPANDQCGSGCWVLPTPPGPPPPGGWSKDVMEPHEGHGFYGEGARERMYAAVLDFLRASTAARREVR